MTPDLTKCECTTPGKCSRYNRRMVGKPFRICQGIELTPQRCTEYRIKWWNQLATPVNQIDPQQFKTTPMAKLKWSYGVTTVPQRLDTLLPQTLKSLAAAGFTQPRLFIDGAKDDRKYQHLGLETTTHYPHLQTFGNWILALWELYIRNPKADRYAIFQDDLITYKNLRWYLDRVYWPEDGYFNLYTFPENQMLVPDVRLSGWYPSNQKGLGAVALIFTRDVVQKLLSSSEHIVDRPTIAGRKSTSGVDGGVVDALKKQGIKEYVHNPSLVQHTGNPEEGHLSTMHHQQFKKSPSFMGEDFDAMQMLEVGDLKAEKYLGDHVKSILSSVGITPSKVTNWLGAPCGCKERQEKLNQFDRWVRRIVAGKTEKAKQYLEEMMQ